MKRIFAVLLILTLLAGCVPALAADQNEYEAALDMTINEFINKYNMIQSPLGAPYQKLTINPSIVDMDGNYCSLFSPTESAGVDMMLVSMQDNNQTANAGADAVFLLCYTDTEWLAFISVARRITSIFSAEVFGVNYSSLYTGSLFSDFYEARAQENDQYYYVQLGSESKYCIALYKYNGMYIFVLTSLDLLDEIMGG